MGAMQKVVVASRVELPGYKLLGRQRVKVTKGSAMEVDEEYDVPIRGSATLRVRELHWLVKPDGGAAVQLVLGFLTDRYDAALAAAVRSSIRIG